MSDENLVDVMLSQDRVLVSAELHLANGSFLQPTGFPDIGACVYTDGAGQRRCLVESEQSMANRLEAVCMKAPGVWREPLAGKLPVIRLNNTSGRLLATNLTEPHRIASSYLLEGTIEATKSSGDKKETLGQRLKAYLCLEDKSWPLDRRDRLTQAVFALDPAAILHGYQFMQWEVVGLRAARLLHARLEADLAADGEVYYGLVKVDGIEPGRSAEKKSNKGQSLAAKARYVPTSIRATFEIDVLALREKALITVHEKDAGPDPENETAKRFLLALALWKIHRFLTNAPSFDARTGDTMGALRLRADCTLAVGQVSWCGSKHGAAFGHPESLNLAKLVAGTTGDDDLLANPPEFQKLMKLFSLELDTTVTH